MVQLWRKGVKMNFIMLILSLYIMPATAVQEPSLIEQRYQSDPSVDRNIVFSTAETLSEGDIVFNSYQVFFIGVSYGLTDWTEFSMTALYPVEGATAVAAIFSLKQKLFQGNRFILSIQPNIFGGFNSGSTGGGDAGGMIGFNLLCDILLFSHITLSFSQSNIVLSNIFDDPVIMGVSMGITTEINDFLKLMVEGALFRGYKDGELREVEESYLITYGIRYFNKSFAIDLSMIRSEHFLSFPAGFPFLAISGRF